MSAPKPTRHPRTPRKLATEPRLGRSQPRCYDEAKYDEKDPTCRLVCLVRGPCRIRREAREKIKPSEGAG